MQVLALERLTSLAATSLSAPEFPHAKRHAHMERSKRLDSARLVIVAVHVTNRSMSTSKLMPKAKASEYSSYCCPRRRQEVLAVNIVCLIFNIAKVDFVRETAIEEPIIGLLGIQNFWA